MTVMFVLLGAPGSGKGTQAVKIKATYEDTKHISTGDLLRDEVAMKTSLGKEIEAILDNGALVPDVLITELFRSVLSRSRHSHMIADGFPRTHSQAKSLQNELAQEFNLKLIPILFDVSKEVLLERIENRRICPNCKTVYDNKINSPMEKGVCNTCRIGLEKRKDDESSVVLTRYETYRQEIAPVLDLFSAHLVIISADQTPEAVFLETRQVIDHMLGIENV